MTTAGQGEVRSCGDLAVGCGHCIENRSGLAGRATGADRLDLERRLQVVGHVVDRVVAVVGVLGGRHVDHAG